MQISFVQFKIAVAQAHAANVKHNNLSCFLFRNVRATIVAYASTTPNWRQHVTKKQAEDTIPCCIELEG